MDCRQMRANHLLQRAGHTGDLTHFDATIGSDRYLAAEVGVQDTGIVSGEDAGGCGTQAQQESCPWDYPHFE